MTIKEICETIITYDDGLSDTLNAAIIDGKAIFRGFVGTDEYILYCNEAGSISVESITLDPDGDGEDILELVINDDDIHGLITMSGFLTDYTFLNNKVAEIQSGTDSLGDTYKYIRFKTATDFDVTYVSVTHEGTLTSIWYEDMQRSIAYFSIATFIPMARKISEDTSIYVTKNYGDTAITPTGISEVKEFSKTYMNNGKKIIRDYYIRMHNASNA